MLDRLNGISIDDVTGPGLLFSDDAVNYAESPQTVQDDLRKIESCVEKSKMSLNVVSVVSWCSAQERVLVAVCLVLRKHCSYIRACVCQ